MQPQRLDGLSFGAGVLFVALGVAFLFEDAIDVLTTPWLWPVLLVVVGLALLVAAARRGNGGEPAGEGTATLPLREPPGEAPPPFPPAPEREGPSSGEPTAELPPAPGAQPYPAAEESAGGDEAEPSGRQDGADPGAAPGNREPRA